MELTLIRLEEGWEEKQKEAAVEKQAAAEKAAAKKAETGTKKGGKKRY